MWDQWNIFLHKQQLGQLELGEVQSNFKNFPPGFLQGLASLELDTIMVVPSLSNFYLNYQGVPIETA